MKLMSTPGKPINVLLLEDQATDAELLVHELRRIERAATTPVIMFTATTRQIEDVVEQEGVTFIHKSTGNRKLLAKQAEETVRKGLVAALTGAPA